jgi:hypothetical protein
VTDCLDVIHSLDVTDFLHCEFDVDFVSRLESLQTWSPVWTVCAGLLSGPSALVSTTGSAVDGTAPAGVVTGFPAMPRPFSDDGSARMISADSDPLAQISAIDFVINGAAGIHDLPTVANVVFMVTAPPPA